jgi:predicted permease
MSLGSVLNPRAFGGLLSVVIGTKKSTLFFAYLDVQVQAAVLLNSCPSGSNWHLIFQRYNCRRLNQSLEDAMTPLSSLAANLQYNSRLTRSRLVMNIIALLIASESHLGPFRGVYYG